MYLLVGIDTEGDNQWDAVARRDQKFENIYALPRLHDLFVRHGARPTYVITHPVATDPRSGEVLRTLLVRGDCEVGAHHHAWETPPCTEQDVRRHPYAAWLPRQQFEAQLTSLTDAIASATGERPVSYRSGRFGFSADHVAALESAGYLVESSVAPLFYEGHKAEGALRGPDFVEAPLRPYYLAYDSATRAGCSNLLEVPVSAALNRRLPRAVQIAYARAPRNYTTKRVLRALGIARVRWLRPSWSSLDDMKALARQLADAGEPVLNLLFHSSEAIVGGSPYNRTQGELDAFCARLEGFLRYATEALGARAVTFREFRQLYGG
jgi:peptidoglycan/xylan/chitin deacetylase (PgdA/CDA1 family)